MINDIQVYRPGLGLLYPYEGDRVVVQHGDVLRVHVSFNYRDPLGLECDIIGYLGTRTSKVITGSTRCNLPPASELTPASAVVDIGIKKPGLLGIGGINPGIYNLGVEIPQSVAYYEIPAAVEVTAAPGIMDNIGSMISMMIVFMMMGMMMNMMED